MRLTIETGKKKREVVDIMKEVEAQLAATMDFATYRYCIRRRH
jgi:hypothetical protein